MAKTRAIVKRRKAVRNIRKITRTMELIATARFKKAQERAEQAAAYTLRVAKLVGDLANSGAATEHPLLEARPVRRSILLVLTSNRGLCGGYNANVLRLAQRLYSDLHVQFPIDIEMSGKRGLAFCRYRGYHVAQSYTQFEDKPQYSQVDLLADRYIDLFLAGHIDRLDVVFTRFYSAGRQQAEVATLLPMTQLTTNPMPAPAGGATAVQYEFQPSPEEILRQLVPESFKTRLFKCFLDAAVSEQIARRVAMKGATENAGQLIKSLSRDYNRVRQATITSELSEIIGTAEALK